MMLDGWARIGLLGALVLGLLVVGVGALAGGINDADSYELVARLDPDTHTLSATQTLTFFNDGEEAVDEILFALVANEGSEPNPYVHPAHLDEAYPHGFDPTWTRVREVVDEEGVPLDFEYEVLPPYYATFSLEDALLRVHLPEEVEPGERVQISMEFETKFARARIGDMKVTDGVYIWRWGWNPIVYTDEQIDEERFELPSAHYELELTVPADFVVAGGADRQNVINQDDDWKTIRLENNGLTRSVPLVMGRDLERYELRSGDVVIESYTLPRGERTGRLLAIYAADSIAWFEQHFGPYPYQRLVIAENPVPGLGGMAADAMILVFSDWYRYLDIPAEGTLDRFAEYLIAHEVAHQWWGIGVGTDFNAENWISEGFAEYLALSYFEDRHGAFEPNLFAHLEGGLLEEVIRSEFGFMNLRRHQFELPYLSMLQERFDEEIVKPLSETRYPHTRVVRDYNKSYLVLRALEGKLGRDTTREIVRKVYELYRGRILRTETLREIAEDVSGVDLESFFESWLYGVATIDISAEDFTMKEMTGGYETTVRLRREGEAVLPVTVRAYTEDEEYADETWSAEERQGTVVFQTEAPVTRIRVDPREMIPDRDRSNHHLPRRLIVRHPFMADAWKVGIPLDAHVLEVGFLSLAGSFRGDYMWNFAVSPEPVVIDEEENELGVRWHAAGNFFSHLDRGLTAHGLLTVTDFDPATRSGSLYAEARLSWIGYERMPTGLAAPTWYPSHRLQATGGLAGPLNEPIAFVGLDYTRDDILTDFRENTLSFKVGLPAFGHEPFVRAEWTGFARTRPAPRWYLDGTLSLGTGFMNALPSAFQFDLRRMAAFAEPFPGDRRAFGRLALKPPPLGENIGYSLLGLARLERITASAFAQGGETWELQQPFVFEAPVAEVGVEFALEIRTFLGLPLGVTVGWAYPVVGAEPDAGWQVFGRFALDIF